jgi:SAM-dependent methyltransferase
MRPELRRAAIQGDRTLCSDSVPRIEHPKRPKQVHPFPARMAPELALTALKRAPNDAVVLDPMCGSGTVLKHARERGMSAIGFDIDPLAVLVSRVACSHVDEGMLWKAASALVAEARQVGVVELPWIDEDSDTAAFVRFWFYARQRESLRKLAVLLHTRRGKIADALRVALSRTIITKDTGASRARDVSHSRPHRVRTTNSFDVYAGFLRAVEQIAPLINAPKPGNVYVARGDARRLPRTLRESVDLVVTSPPYLNAIDYLRGHRMSLVWLGYNIGDLKLLRSISVGAERAPDPATLKSPLEPSRNPHLTGQQRGMLHRYTIDTDQLMSELAAVLRPNGEAVIVAGDSTLSGVYVRNSRIIHDAAVRHGLVLVDRRSRPLPSGSRYLPPPSAAEGALSKRMRREVVMRFVRARQEPRTA